MQAHFEAVGEMKLGRKAGLNGDSCQAEGYGAALGDFMPFCEPAIRQMLDAIRRAAADAKVPVSVCGDLASHGLVIPVLLGLGLERAVDALGLPSLTGREAEGVDERDVFLAITEFSGSSL